jgi:hypothetical protein
MSEQYPPFVFRDGYTEDVYIKPEPGFWPAIRFRMRPCTIAERATLIEQSKGQPGKMQEWIVADALAKHIVQWSLTEHTADGVQPLEISAETIMCFRFHVLLVRMAGIVIYGDQVGDVDPQKSADEVMDDLRRRAEMLEQGVDDYGKHREEAAAKN